MTAAVSATALARVPLTDLAAATAEVRAEVEDAWSRSLATSGFIGGVEVEAFEAEWADYCGAAEAIGVANGTDAIELTLRGLGIGPGDEVVVPANTFVATVEGVVLAGATPVLVDVDPTTLLVTPEIVGAARSARTAAVIAVDLYGALPALDALGELAARSGIALIEDAAQAHGASLSGRRAGSFGVAGCFSFYPTKNLGAFGDAGGIVTSDPQLARSIRLLIDHGRPAGARDRHDLVARNSRLDAVQAAVLRAKLRRLDVWNHQRRRVAATYDLALDGAVKTPPRVTEEARWVYHQYVVRVPDRDSVRAALAADGIGTGVHYPIPCHKQDPYRTFASERLPVCERSAGEILSLPMFPHLSTEQVERVCRAVNSAIGGEDA